MRVAAYARREFVLTVLATLVAATTYADEDLAALTKKFPRAKVLVEVTFDKPFEARDMQMLQPLRLRGITRNKDAMVGRDKLIFEGSAGDVAQLRANSSKKVVSVRWIKTYPSAARYAIYFEYVGEEIAPELAFTIAMPRSATGRTLRKLQSFVWPQTETTTASDDAGNSFLTARFVNVKPQQEILFDFYAAYDYDSEAIVNSSLAGVGPTPMPETWPEEARPFLKPGFHIESDAPEIVQAAKALGRQERLDERARAVLAYAHQRVKYDHDKRERYFGGRYVYRDPWEMWQGPVATLKRGMGCCPDTAELAAALLRAVGVPARTAVHSGHLYAEIYVPSRGWVTDAPMYNIPLLRAPGPDNRSYFEWQPAVSVRCVEWKGEIVPFGTIRPGMTLDDRH